MLDRNQKRKKRHQRLRTKVTGTAARPRLNVYRSNEHLYVQLIDDMLGHTLVSVSSLEKNMRSEFEKERGLASAYKIGMEIAKKAKEQNIEQVVFDRGGYKYHGCIKAIADGAREGGLKF